MVLYKSYMHHRRDTLLLLLWFSVDILCYNVINWGNQDLSNFSKLLKNQVEPVL
jgi:hypothetical protein